MGNSCRNLFRKCFSKTTAASPESQFYITNVSDNRDGYFSNEDLNMLVNKYPEWAEPDNVKPDNKGNIKHLFDGSKKHKKIKYISKIQVGKLNGIARIRWKEGEVIGHGSFGRVVSGLNLSTGEIMAVKQVHIGGLQSPAAKERIKALELEVELLSKLKHKNIVRYMGTDRTKTTLNIFLEYISGGSIATLINKYGKLNETLIRLYIRQILEGLEYLHFRGTIHRDIKGGNVLVDNHGNCKLADFGSAKQLYSLKEGDDLNSLKGTANWMAPEVIRQKDLSRFSDIWSVGCMIIEMSTGRPPWSEYSSQITTLFQIAQNKRAPAIPSDLSPECIDFLKLCFKKNPKERPNVTKLLQHKFIYGNDAFLKNPSKSLTFSSLLGNNANEGGKLQIFEITPEKAKISRIFEFGPKDLNEKPTFLSKSIHLSKGNSKAPKRSKSIGPTDDSKCDSKQQVVQKPTEEESKEKADDDMKFHKSVDFSKNDEKIAQLNASKSKSKKDLGPNKTPQTTKRFTLNIFKKNDNKYIQQLTNQKREQEISPVDPQLKKGKMKAAEIAEIKKWGKDIEKYFIQRPKKILDATPKQEIGNVSEGLNVSTGSAMNLDSGMKLIVSKKNFDAESPEVRIHHGVSSLDNSDVMHRSSIKLDESSNYLKIKECDPLNESNQCEQSFEQSFDKREISFQHDTSMCPMVIPEKNELEMATKMEDKPVVGEILRKKAK